MIIVHNHHGFYSTNVKFQPKRDFQVIQITVPERTTTFLTLNQPDHRKFPKLKNFKLSYLRGLLAKVKDESLEYCSGFHGSEKFLTLESSLSSGTYMFLIEICPHLEKSPKLVLDAYGDKPVKFELLAIYPQDFATLQSTVMRSYCVKIPRYPNLEEKDFGKEGSRDIRRFFGYVHGILFLYYVNYSKEYEMEEVIREKSRMKLKVCPPFKGFPSCKD